MTRQPIMSPEEERYMAFEGLVQWTQAVISQAKRVDHVFERMRSDEFKRDPGIRRNTVLASHCECHYFSIAANKLIEHRDWVQTLELFKTVDFGAIDQFSKSDIKELRNMREHVVEYFKGLGHDKSRWFIETPEYKADASSVVGNMIGGRLDWVRFSAAAEQLLPALLAEPSPKI